MKMRNGVVTFAIFSCFLLSSFATCGSAFIGASSGGSKDDRNEIQGGYSLREPDLPALYSAPKSHQEQDAQDNEVDQQSSTDRDSTTTEVYFEDREEDTSEDYPYTTLATQNPRDVPASEYGAPTTPEKPYSSSQDNTGGYGGYADSRRKDKIQNSNNSQQHENTHNSKPLDQMQIENHQFPQHAYIPPMNQHGQAQQQQRHQAITSQYGPPNSLPQSEHNRVTEEIHNHLNQFNPQQQKNSYDNNNQFSRTNDHHNDYQPQYLPPQSETYNNNRESHKQPEQPQSLNEPQRYVTAHDITNAARDYGTPVSYHSQSSPSLQNSQEQGYFPQGEHAGQQNNNNYETPQNPTGNYQQQERPFQQQAQRHQENQQFQSQQYGPPQQQQYQPQQQQHQPQQQQHQPQQQQQHQQLQQQPQQHQQQQHQPQYQPQQQEYQPQPQDYQGQQQHQGQPQQSNQEHPQQQQQQFYSSPAAQPQQPQEIPQKPQQYLPPTNDFQQSPKYPSEEKNQRAMEQRENRGNNNGIPSGNDIFEFDGFHDNDNVVDAELLQRVQQIIEEHERTQKEIQDKVRREHEANEAFFRTTHNNIESSRSDFNAAGAGTNGQNEGPYFPEDNNSRLAADNNRLNEQGFYGRPSVTNNNSAGMHNEVEKQRSLQLYPKPGGFPESAHLDKLGETKNYLNSPYGVPTIQFESDPFRQEQQQALPGNQNRNNLQVYPSSLSSAEDSHNQFHPKSQSSQYTQQQQQQSFPDGVNDISNERQYESSPVSYNNGPQNQVPWSNPTLSNPLNTANAPLSNTDPMQSGQRSNENPSHQAPSSGKPHIEYQKAILTEHFVETKPEFPSRGREDASRRGGEFSISSFEIPNNLAPTSQGKEPFPSQLTSSHESNQFQSQNPSAYNNRGSEQQNDKIQSAYASPNELDNRPRDLNQYQQNQQPGSNAQSQIGNSNFYNNPPNNEENQNREINSDGEILHFSNQYGLPYSQPTAAINYQENLRNDAERVVQDLSATAPPKHDQPQYTNQPGSYPTSFSSHENSRTIVVHEVPFASVQGVSNRVVINPNEQSSPLSNGNEYKEQQQHESLDNSFRNNPLSDNEINFLYNSNKNPLSFQPQAAFQDNQPNLQYGLQQQGGSQQNQEGKTSDYLPPPPSDTSSNSAYMSGSLGSNEIPSLTPKPIYGIPLAPVLDPESLTAIDQRDSSVVLSSQISFGDIGGLSSSEQQANPNDNINILPYSSIVGSHQQQIHEPQQYQPQQQLQQLQQQQQQQQYQPQQQQLQQYQPQQEHIQQQEYQVQQEQFQPQQHQSQHEQIQQQHHQLQQEIIQQQQQLQYQIQQEHLQIQQQQPLQVPLNEFYAQPQSLPSGNSGSNDFSNNQIQLKPEIPAQYGNLARQGSWISDSASDVTAVPAALYGLPQSGPSAVSEVYGVSNQTSSSPNPSSASIYSLNDAPLTSISPLVSSNSVSSPSQPGYFYPRRNRSLKPKFSSPVRSPLVTSFTVKSNNKE